LLGSSSNPAAFSLSGLPRAIARQSRYFCIIPARNRRCPQVMNQPHVPKVI
jgi:hypothetical protein